MENRKRDSTLFEAAIWNSGESQVGGKKLAYFRPL